MKYNRCLRCELNYVPSDEQYCMICKKELAGEYYVEVFIEENICPYCEKNPLGYGEEMCDNCALKKIIKNKNINE